MKKLLFVFNPRSGTGEISRHLADVLDIFTKADYEVVTYPTQGPKDGSKKIISDGMRFDRIVAAGGDGMFHELINAVLSLPEKVTVGYIPTGTVNDFASSNKIPKNILHAAEIAVSDNVKALDVGNFNGEYFSYIAAFGLITNVAYDTDQRAKNTWGFLAYLGEAAKNLNYATMNSVCRKMKICTDDGCLEDEFIFGAVSNSLSIAGLQNFVGHNVVLNDGIIEGLFIRKPKDIFEFDEIVDCLLFRDFDSPYISYIQSSRFEIETEPVAWTLDGENGGEHGNTVVTAEKQVLNIALPKDDE